MGGTKVMKILEIRDINLRVEKNLNVVVANRLCIRKGIVQTKT